MTRPVGTRAGATSEQGIGTAAGVAAYTLWGLFPLVFHQLRSVSATEILLHRVVWSFVVVSLLLLWRRDRQWYAALRGLTVARAAILQLLVPVLAAAGGILLLGELASLRLLVAGAAILGGVALAILGRQ